MEGCRQSKLLVTRQQDIDHGSAMFIGELAIVGEKGAATWRWRNRSPTLSPKQTAGL